MKTYLNVIPRVHDLPSFYPKQGTGWEGITALWYEGAKYQGKPTKVFAYLGYPTVKPGEKVPAVVLVHGGGGHAYAEWVKIWNQRGYAAIAMDTTGYFPSEQCRGLTGIENGPNEGYVRELYGELTDERYTVGPDNDGLETSDIPLEGQWMYHAVVDTILAHNILRNDARIDERKIGICGVSWGGNITSIAVGCDTRYAFAIPIYGCGYLEYSKTETCKWTKNERARELWCAERNFHKVNCPVLWLTGLHDQNFSPESNRRSYEATKGTGSILCVKEDLLHGHIVAWECEECYQFADKVISEVR